MGRVVRTDIPHRKAVMLVMKHIGKEYTFEKVDAIDIIEDDEDRSAYIISQGSLTYAINLDVPKLGGEPAEMHEVPVSAIKGNDEGEAKLLKKCADKLKNYTQGYEEVIKDIERDAARKSAAMSIEITRFHRK